MSPPVGDGELDVDDVRRVAATVLVVLGCIFLLVGGATFYARQEVFDADHFAQRASSSLEDEDVRTVLSDQIVEQIIDQGSSELIQAKPLLQAVVSNVLGSGPFRAIFRKAAVQVHKALFSRDEGSIVLDLADIGTVVIGAAKAVAPGVAKKIPRDVEPGLIKISERSFATKSLDIASKVRFLGILLPILTLACFVGAFVVGRDRRRTTVNLGAGVAAVGAVGVVAYLVGHALLVSRFDDEEQHRAAGAVWDAYLVDLRTSCLIAGGAGIIVAAAASTYLQHVDITDEAEALGRRLLARPKGRWAQLGRALGIAALSLFVVLEPTYAVQVVVIVVGAFGLYYAVGELMRLYQPRRRRDARASAVEQARLRGYTRRVAIVTAVTAAVVAVGVVALLFTRGGDEDPPARAKVPITECNGYAALCGRPLNEVAFPATHNSMSAAASRGWYLAGQRGDVAAQLRYGVRGLLIDTHYGVRNEKGVVRTNLAREGTTRAKVVAELGEQSFAAAERLAGRLGGSAKGTPGLYMCHTVCELGATPLVGGLEQLRTFLEDFPNEVVMVFIQDAISPEDTASTFSQAGLGPYLYTHDRDSPWPTLRQMISSGRRLMVMAEDITTGGPTWYHQGFELVQETPYEFKTVSELEAPTSCAANRGTPDSPLFQLNHWIERANPSPGLAGNVNAYDVLLARAQRCRRERGLVPNLVNVDFYDEGDLLDIVRVLNGLPRDASPVYRSSR